MTVIRASRQFFHFYLNVDSALPIGDKCLYERVKYIILSKYFFGLAMTHYINANQKNTKGPNVAEGIRVICFMLDIQ